MATDTISVMEKDKIFMSRAISLARKGLYGAHPNPMVGAVLVKGGRITGEGWHKEFGGPHAEVNAIRSAAGSAKGSALYVTLEPCSTTGRTGPCTGAIIAAGVRKVVIGAPDPNPVNAGKAAPILRAAGIEVEKSVLSREAAALNPAFNKFMRTGLPFVTLKAAQSLDGKTAGFKGRSRWISSPASRKEGHRLRAEADAVLAGINTVLADDPLLNVRGLGIKRQPAVVILDSALRIPRNARVLDNEKVIIAATRKAPRRRIRALRLSSNITVLILPPGKNGGVDLRALLGELGRLGIAHLLVEGGGRVAGSFILQGLFDRLMFFCAPLIIGGSGAGSSAVWRDAELPGGALGMGLRFKEIRRLGPDILVEAEPCSRGS